MRLLMDGVIALMLVGVLGGVLWHQRARADELRQVEAAQRAVRAIQSQALYRGSLRQVQVSRRGYPLRIDPAWFATPPTNLLTVDAGDWLETAGPADEQRTHPEHITTDGRRAAFWYNPHRGVVRARVNRQPSEQTTVELYNLVNGTAVRVAEVRGALSRPPASH